MNMPPLPTLMSSMSCTCSSDLRVFWLSRSASSPPLLSSIGISSSSIFRDASHAERTKHRRPADARSTLQLRFAPSGFWTPPPRQAVVPFQKTCHVALGVGLRSAPSGQV